ncbi:MFS transporter, partial [Kineococcus glutinatus]|uniref:MFS transporter n=1 Tax=Kineococcus glutinatus TaxID=1070872 RepID=UPI0031E8BB5F
MPSADPAPPLAPPPGPADRLPVGRLALLAAAVLAAVTTELLPVGLLPQLADAFAVGTERIGWWMSAYALVVAATAVPLTAVLARWPGRRVLVVLLSAYALSNAVIAVAGDDRVALAARLLGGLAHAGIFSVVVTTAVALAPPRRSGRAVALVNTGVTAALALGVPLGTAAGTALGWRWAFAAAAACLLLLAAATALLLLATPA